MGIMRRVRRIAKRNGIKNASMIHPGEKIDGYRVKKGDTLYGIAQRERAGKITPPGHAKKAAGAKSAAPFAPGMSRAKSRPSGGAVQPFQGRGRPRGIPRQLQGGGPTPIKGKKPSGIPTQLQGGGPTPITTKPGVFARPPVPPVRRKKS